MAKNNTTAKNKAISDQATLWLTRLQAGDISESERQRFQDWCHADPAHSAAYEQAQKFWDLLETPATRVHSQTNAKRRLKTVPALRYAWAGTALAFIVLIAIELPGHYQNWQSDYYTRPGERQMVDLQDGSKLTLNTDSAVTVEFSDQERRIRLIRGEAYFSVAPDKAWPFIVTAENVAARAVGTAFSVNALVDNVQVAVNEGLVAVSADRQELQVKAAQQANYRDGQLVASPVAIEDALAWLNGQVVFDRQPLAKVVNTMNRYRKGAIVIANPALKERIISGVFKADDPKAVVAALQNTLHTHEWDMPGEVVVLY